MNERIRQLKEQARDFYLLQEDLECSIKELHELVDTKFAELIVRECMKTADEGMAQVTMKVEWPSYHIKKHFEVE